MAVFGEGIYVRPFQVGSVIVTIYLISDLSLFPVKRIFAVDRIPDIYIGVIDKS